jgi:acylphosphatase
VTRLRAIVIGRVQGVGYRASAAHEARRLGVRGWVRNRYDGTVELEAHAEAAVLETFLVYLRHGPPGARVRSVDVEWLPASSDAGSSSEFSFEIR